MKKYVLTVDIGKYEANLIGRDLDGTKEDIKKVNLRTKMYDLENGYIDVEGDNSHKIVFDAKTYIVGEQGQDKSYDTSKTNILHKLTCYTAITEYLEPGTKDNKISMVLACPLSVLRTPVAKEEYKSFIKGDGEINIIVDGEEYSFEIEDITIKAEGSGIVYLEPKRFESKDILVIDLGGLNQGISLYRNKSCKSDDRFIEECGTERLIELVRTQLMEYKKGNNVDSDTAEKVLRDGGLKKAGVLDEESVVYLNRAKNNYFNEVMQNVKAHKFNIDHLDEVIFVGGTTQHIKSIITKEIKHSYIPENSQWTTVEGLYKIAIKKYGK